MNPLTRYLGSASIIILFIIIIIIVIIIIIIISSSSSSIIIIVYGMQQASYCIVVWCVSMYGKLRTSKRILTNCAWI